MGVLTVSGNEINDLARANALAWVSTQQGGSTDGQGYKKITNLVLRSFFNGTFTGSWSAGGAWFGNADTAHGASVSATMVTDNAFPSDPTNVAEIVHHEPAGSGWAYLAVPIPAGGFKLGHQYTLSFYARVAAGTAQTMTATVEDSNGINIVMVSRTFTPNSSVQRFSFTFTANNIGNNPVVFLNAGAAGVGDVTMHYTSVQIEFGATANNYVATTGAIASARQGSGDSSYQVCSPAQNLFKHGQCDAVGLTSDGWATGGSGGVMSTAVDALTPAPFSQQSVSVTVDGANNNQGLMATATGSWVAGSIVASSVWFKGQVGKSYRHVIAYFNGAVERSGTATGFVATGDWQLLMPVSFTVQAGDTATILRLYVLTTTAVVDVFNVAHAMIESISAGNGRNYVSPYVPTSAGSASSRNATRVQDSVAPFTPAQGWVVARIKMGFASSAAFAARIAWYAVDSSGTSRISCSLNAAGQVQIENNNGAATQSLSDTLAGWAFGDSLFVAYSWTAANILVSRDGRAWTTVARNGIPAGVLTLDIGSNSGANQFLDARIMWLACGSGVLSNADLTTLNALGDTAPSLGLLGSAAGTMMVWGADTNIDSAYMDAPVTNDLASSATVNAPGVVYNLGGGAYTAVGTATGAGTKLAQGGGAETATATLVGAGTVYDGGGFPFFADTIFAGSGTDYVKGSGTMQGNSDFEGDGEILRSPPAFSTGKVSQPRTGDIKFVRSEN